MKIYDTVYESVVEPSYKTTRSDANSSGHNNNLEN